MTVIFGRSRHITVPALTGVRVHAHRGTAASAGWWIVAGKTCIAAYQPKGAASYAASLVNLANPGTYDAAAGVTPGWNAATGWDFSSDKWLDTFIVPTATMSVLARFTDGGTTSCTMFGQSNSATARLHFYSHYGDGNCYYRHGGSGISTGYDSGVMGITEAYGYKNGAPDIAITGAWSGTATLAMVLGGYRGAPNVGWPGKIQAWVAYAETLTDAQIATLSTAMAAL